MMKSMLSYTSEPKTVGFPKSESFPTEVANFKKTVD